VRSYKLSIYQEFTKTAFLLIVLGNPGFACEVMATEISSLNSSRHSGDPLDNWPTASDSELEEQRGGFLLPNGVHIDFGIEKLVYLNGVETFSSYFQFPENNFLLQNGDGNMASDLNGSALASVIQNNLDDQVIRTVNEINLEISNLHNLNHDIKAFTDNIISNLFH